MEEKKPAKGPGISGTTMAAVGGGIALLAAGLYFSSRGTFIKGDLAFTHKGSRMDVWAGFGISPGVEAVTGRHKPLVWEKHELVSCTNAWPDVNTYTVNIKEKTPKDLAEGKYHVFAFVHSAAGSIDMDPDQSMGELGKEILPDGVSFIWKLMPQNWWQYFIDKPSSYILGRWYNNGIQVSQPLLGGLSR